MSGARAIIGLGLALSVACATGEEATSIAFHPTTPTSATITAGATTQEPSVTDGGDGGTDSAGQDPPPTTMSGGGSATSTTTTTTTSGGGGGGVCGDGVRDASEACDGADLADKTCQSFGWDDGVLACAADCTFFFDACFRCGDGVKDMAEACDGADLGGRTCASEGFGGGVLKCRQDCKGVDTAGCTPLASCGNGVKEGSEQCDGAQLGGQTCVGLGFDGGSLVCSPACTFDTGSCTALDCAGQGEICLFDPNNVQSNCCPPGVKGNVLGICDLIVCL